MDEANNLDLGRVLKQIEAAKAHVGRLPVYVAGASSGGTFASILASHGGFAGLLVMVSPGHKDAWVKELPPTAFLYMTKDRWASKALVQRGVSALKALNIRVAEFEAKPKPVSTEFLVDHLPELDNTQADKLRKNLMDAKHISPDGMLINNPRNFCLYLQETSVSLPRFCEVLNVAYAGHEMTSDFFDQVLDFWRVASA